MYANENPELVRNLSHSDEEMRQFTGRRILDQLDFRLAAIERELAGDNYDTRQFDAVVGRGGLMRGLPSGTYRVNEEMLGDLRLTRYGDHASNLGAFLAQQIATRSRGRGLCRRSRQRGRVARQGAHLR